MTFIPSKRKPPKELREANRVYAWAHGYFWLPCPVCGRDFGGHESITSVPDPERPSHGFVICAFCVAEGKGDPS